MYQLERTQLIERTIDDVFAFHCDAQNLEAITPPFLGFHILTPMPVKMEVGARIDYALSLFGVPIRWTTRITAWEPGVRFVDEQESGPYAFWRHTHEFEPHGSGTLVHDVVEYELPLGALGRAAHAIFVERTLHRIFDFRAHATASRFLVPASP
jgi:ligand-binding SRPBCC domain-containing protein